MHYYNIVPDDTIAVLEVYQFCSYHNYYTVAHGTRCLSSMSTVSKLKFNESLSYDSALTSQWFVMDSASPNAI